MLCGIDVGSTTCKYVLWSGGEVLAVRQVATTYIIYQRGKLLRDAPEQQLQRYPVDNDISAADCLTLRAVISVNPLQTPETLVLPFRLNELVRFPKRSPFGYECKSASLP